MRLSLLLSALLVTFASGDVLLGQSAVPLAVERDPQAISVLKQTIAAMSMGTSPTLSDITGEGTCTVWNGEDQSAPITDSIIRGVASRFEVRLSDSTVSRTVAQTASSFVDEHGNQHAMPFKIAAQGLWYLPLPYLLDGLANPATSLALISPNAEDTTDASNDQSLRFTTAPLPGSVAVKDYADATTHIIHIDRSTHLITEIDDKAYLLTDLSSSVSHSLHYSDYREESGLVLPHQIDEYIASNHVHTFIFSHFYLNTGITALPSPN